MLKTCKSCNREFNTRDSRVATCGDPQCISKSRSLSVKLSKLPKFTGSVEKDYIATPVGPVDLPDPDELPAPYLKKCYDLWVELTENPHTSPRKI